MSRIDLLELPYADQAGALLARTTPGDVRGWRRSRSPHTRAAALSALGEPRRGRGGRQGGITRLTDNIPLNFGGTQ